MTLSRLVLGFAVGAAASLLYSRRMELRAMLRPRPEQPALPLDTATIVSDGAARTAVQVREVESTAMQTTSGAPSIITRIQQSLASARAQLDAAIAEGQIAAEKRRAELEDRFATAKKDPAVARESFR